ncbi:MAG: PQQ-binding-like beta-propeller repeat protein [Limisphaerales bacterium]
MMADSPVTFPKEGALPAKYPPDVHVRDEPAEKDYYIFSSPCRSLAQIAEIQAAMPKGRFTPPAPDWRPLRRTRQILTEGGELRLLALGDSIVNDTMRSGWVARLAQAYPKARIQATVYVRGGGGCQHFKELDRIATNVIPRRPNLVFIGGISQKDIESIGEVIHQLRAGSPGVEILLATGAFGTADPRDPEALAKAPHSGTGAYGQALRKLAAEEGCAFLDMTAPWAEYIRSAQVHPHLFYRDAVHANEYGEQILSKVLMAFWTAAEAQAHYFRSDLGRAEATAGPLPGNLDDPHALVWKTPLAPGQSSPILSHGQLFLTTYRSEAKEVATLALDAATGQIKWTRVAPASRIEVFHPQMGSAAVATPACDGTRLYVFFGSFGLVCYDLAGKTLWEHPLGPLRDEYGAGSSPVLVDDKVVLCEDHDIDSFLLAVDRLTGKTLWKVRRPDAVRSYATPVPWMRDGRTELLVAGSLELAGYNPANGELAWWTHGLARIVIPVPVPAGDMVYMASWAPGGDPGQRLALDPWPVALAKWDKNKDGRLSRAEIDDPEVLDRFARMDLDQSGDLDQAEWERHAAVFRRAQNALLALQPSGRGELPERALLWKYTRGIPYVSSPLLDHGILWLVKDGGLVTKLDAASGQLLQEQRLPGRGGYYASPVAGDGKVYLASEQGVVTVVANQKEWKSISSRDFHEKIYATPAFGPSRLYLRTNQALYCFTGSPP